MKHFKGYIVRDGVTKQLLWNTLSIDYFETNKLFHDNYQPWDEATLGRYGTYNIEFDYGAAQEALEGE